MSGFSGIFYKNPKYKELKWTFKFPEVLNGHFGKKQSIVLDQLHIALYDNVNKVSDSFIREKKDRISGLSGVVFNLDDFNGIEHSVPEKGLSGIKGSFSAFGYNFAENQFWLATDTTGSRQVFFYDHPDFFLFSSSIFLLRDFLRHFDLHFSLSESASYMMLSLGYLLENHTLIEQVKKLKAGHVLHISGNRLNVKQYHKYFSKVKHTSITKSLLADLDELFIRSLQPEFHKDMAGGLKHLSTLSGGLDSRLIVMLAKKQGYDDITCLTFGEGFSDDELTARKISTDLSLEHFVLLLNHGLHLFDIDAPLLLNNCSVYYFGAAQTLAALKMLNLEPFGLMHHGGLAESSKGGYLSGNEHLTPRLHKRYGVSDKLFDKIPVDMLDEIFAAYPNEEMFITYNRGFNAIHNGNWMTLPYANSVYTYMDQDFADLAYSMHPKLRYNGFMTVKWIKQLHPDIADYPWKLGLKPTNDPKRIFVSKLSNKLRNGLGKGRVSSVPFNRWYENSERLRSFVHNSFSEIHALRDILPDIVYKNTLELFERGTVVEKLLCVSYVRSVKLLFLNDR